MKNLLKLTAGLLLTTSIASALDLNAESYYFYEPTTGAVTLEKNADVQIAPASLTKMMTIHVLFDALKAGEITLNSEFPVSEKAWRKGGSKMFIEVGKTVRVEDLIKGILVSSGNDACIAVAEYLAGTETGFADMMNRKAEDIGMENTKFMNASGWPNPEQLSTAKDMTKLAVSLIENFPEYYKYFGLERFTYSNISQPNRNGLLRRGVGVDGMKTGHVEEAGYHMTASAKRGDVRLVSTVMGTTSMRKREEETLAGLSYSFRTHEMVNIIEAGAVIEKSAPVLLGEAETVQLIAKDGLKMYLPKRDNNPKIESVYNKPLHAPITAGEKVGVVRVTFEDGTVKERDLVAANNVAELTGVAKLWQQLLNNFK